MLRAGGRAAILIGSVAIAFLILVFTSRSPSGIRDSFYSIQHAYANPRLQDRLDYSEKLWEQSVEDRPRIMAIIDDGTEGSVDRQTNPYNAWDLFRPTFNCPHDLERIGTVGDGGKWVCGMSRYEAKCPGPSSESNPAPQLVVYSFGVNVDSSFEAAFLRRTNVEIWGYDYSVDDWAIDIPQARMSRAHFRKALLAKETNETSDPPAFSIQDLMKKNEHDYIDVVKMDIEGAEFEVIPSLIKSLDRKEKDSLLPIGQLLIEIHLDSYARPNDMRSWLDWFVAMERVGMRPVNNEDNWIGDANTGHPTFMEYTLINALDERNVLIHDF